MTLVVKTDNKFRDFYYRSDVPEKVLKDQFSHLEAEETTDGFIKYRGYWYHTSDFSYPPSFENVPFRVDGYLSDTYFSGVIVHLSSDGEQYKIGTYYYTSDP